MFYEDRVLLARGVQDQNFLLRFFSKFGGIKNIIHARSSSGETSSNPPFGCWNRVILVLNKRVSLNTIRRSEDWGLQSDPLDVVKLVYKSKEVRRLIKRSRKGEKKRRKGRLQHDYQYVRKSVINDTLLARQRLVGASNANNSPPSRQNWHPDQERGNRMQSNLGNTPPQIVRENPHPGTQDHSGRAHHLGLSSSGDYCSRTKKLLVCKRRVYSNHGGGNVRFNISEGNGSNE